MTSMGLGSYEKGRRRNTSTEANLAIGRAFLDKADAKERLEEVEVASVEAYEVAGQLRSVRERNHFAERMLAAMSQSRDKDKE